MLTISKKHSLILSLSLSVLFFALCTVGAIFLPHITEVFISMKERFPENGPTVVLILAYCVLFIAAVADGLLFVLLLRVRRSLVFTKASLSLVRSLSWCCLAIGLIFAVLGYYFLISFAVAFAAVFLGLCLRVVKNVLEEASEIKSENDLTV